MSKPPEQCLPRVGGGPVEALGSQVGAVVGDVVATAAGAGADGAEGVGGVVKL
ncbi:hypothetical protein KBX19_10315 [Corynebacterium sp. CCUG 71335]|uniref:hypothetical protein n=1 Tax=Corynebacterium sp. CCUG 71335 TaxID=2823892 RepID=UPI00210AD667|nr:hypothetical protein [Corynebacterium sp. CCUG 71335]MCQ4621604.1 hypothetical protein [Corynebacterium sp. CCUG 71335]